MTKQSDKALLSQELSHLPLEDAWPVSGSRLEMGLASQVGGVGS